MTEWITAHPWLAAFCWCWAWLQLPPLVSVRPYTPREQQRLRDAARDDS